MISAFGVDHGDISKAWKKIAPKMARASNVAKPGQTMQQRMRVNYVQWREKSGYLRREINPKRWDKNDADNLKAGLGPPSERSLESRKRGEDAARKKARNLKSYAQNQIKGISANNRRKRTLP